MTSSRARSAGRFDLGYRALGADLPFGHPERAHGVAMEGYYWRITDPVSRRVVIALIGVQTDRTGCWALAGVGDSAGFWRQAILPEAHADPTGLGVRAAGQGITFWGSEGRLVVDLGADARIDVQLSALSRWPRGRPFGGSSWFQVIPGLNQYWHPWLLGGRVAGSLVVGDRRTRCDAALVYGEKNWGRAGFPDSWWWGQAQGFRQPDACVAFAGGQVVAGPARTEVTGLVVRLPGGRVLRWGNPVSSAVKARVSDEEWVLEGRRAGWSVSVRGHAPLNDALVLPVPLVAGPPGPDGPSGSRRAVPGAIEQLAGELSVRVRRHGRVVWQGRSQLAGLEHGGLERAGALAATRAHSSGVG